MSWALLLGLVVGLAFAFAVTRERKASLQRMRETVRRRQRAVDAGAAEAQLQHPVVDLSRCLGCATCVAVCPEDGVLEMVHGQAMVVNGARCVGVSACERECPVGAITVTLSNVNTRDDIPVVSESLEAVGSPGLYSGWRSHGACADQGRDRSRHRGRRCGGLAVGGCALRLDETASRGDDADRDGSGRRSTDVPR